MNIKADNLADNSIFFSNNFNLLLYDKKFITKIV